MIVAREKTDYYGLPQTPAKKERTSGQRLTRRWVRKDRLALTGMIFLVFCSCVIITSYYALVFSTGYRLNKAQQELNLLRTESHALYTKVNQLSSLGYIEMAAVHKLGMVVPEDDNIVVVQAMASTGSPPSGVGIAATTSSDVAGPGVGDKEVHGPEVQNPMIRAFADMVERLEKSIRTG